MRCRPNPAVGFTVALQIAAQIHKAESYGTAETCSVDDRGNQLCTMLRVDDEPSFFFILMWLTIAVVLVTMLLS